MTEPAAAPARRAVVRARRRRDRRTGRRRSQQVQQRAGTAVLLVEHDVEMVQRGHQPALRARLRARSSPSGPTDEVLGDARPCARPTSGSWCEPADAARRHRCSSSTDVDAAYGPFRALFDVSLAVPEAGGRPARAPTAPARRRWPGCARASLHPTCGAAAASRRGPHRARPYQLARPASSTPPRAARCSPPSPSRRTWSSGFRRRGRASRRAPPACDRAFELFPRLGERRTPGGRHALRRRAAHALPGPGAGPTRRGCSSSTSSRSAWPRSWSRRSTRRSAASGSAGTALLIVEQHVHHALELADEVVVLTKGGVAFRGPPPSCRDELARAAATCGSRRGHLTAVSAILPRSDSCPSAVAARQDRQSAPVHGGERDRRNPDQDGRATDGVGADHPRTIAMCSTCAL